MNPPILSMQPGDTRAGRARVLTLARALALSGGPFDKPNWPDKNLHTDAQAAASTGLSEIVVSGTQWEGYLVGLLAETMGPGWFDGGSLDIKIPRSVKIGETLQPKLTLDRLEGGTAHMSVWCENAEGQQVMVGTAACALPAANAPA